MKQFLAILFLLIGGVAISQSATLKLDTNNLRIGEQTVLHIYFEYQNPNGDALIIWPDNNESISKDIEVVDKTIDVDRLVDSASATYIREQQLLITAFEQGSYIIPSQEIRLGDSLYNTNTDVLFIETVEVDTSKGIADIKPIYAVEYPLSERSKDWLMDNWYWLAIILVIILIFFIWKYLKSRKTEEEEEEVKIIIPAHILALEVLEQLLEKEGWKSDAKKAYYSELTDTVRSYLENRFGIHAMEKTTREIIKDLKYASINEEDKLYLRKILSEADMVKFAKLTPTDEDAFASLNKSIDFVKRTKESENAN